MLIKSGPFEGLKKNGYRAVLMDVPWKFLVRSEKGMDRSPENHYSTMTLEQIKALPIRDLIHPKGTVMYFWVIDTHVQMAFDVLRAYGFAYKTVGFYWAKTNRDGSFFTGMGFWTRANPEHAYEAYFGETEQEVERAFLATVGNPKRTGKDVRRLIVSPRREHSRKPDEIYERIEALTDGPYLELFARQHRPGWSQWGDEINKFGSDPEVEELV
jgi:N6-adenosine-specific RNA methylase IME4